MENDLKYFQFIFTLSIACEVQSLETYFLWEVLDSNHCMLKFENFMRQKSWIFLELSGCKHGGLYSAVLMYNGAFRPKVCFGSVLPFKFKQKHYTASSMYEDKAIYSS